MIFIQEFPSIVPQVFNKIVILKISKNQFSQVYSPNHSMGYCFFAGFTVLTSNIISWVDDDLTSPKAGWEIDLLGISWRYKGNIYIYIMLSSGDISQTVWDVGMSENGVHPQNSNSSKDNCEINQ